MLVTVFSDASWCPRTRVGGWGAWAKSERVQWGVQFSGAFRRLAYSSNEAEIMAAACALASTLRSEVAAEGDTILFEIDNEHALRLVTHDAPTGLRARSDLEKEAIEVLLELKVRHALTFKTRHVKGHSGRERRDRFGVNELCDRLAKKHMLEARQRADDRRAAQGPAASRKKRRRRRRSAGKS
jgi:ribonuclease HI